MKSFAIAFALLISIHAPATAVEAEGNIIQGVASVIDGDTLEVRGSRIRLHGIDAPESGQVCRERDGSGRPGRPGRFAGCIFLRRRKRYGRS